jgi:hypothetical protein
MSDFLGNQSSQSSILGYFSLAIAEAWKATKLIQEFLLNPSLGGVILYVEDYSKKIHSEVSKKKIINSSGQKNIITDNIAPEPFLWTIKGYIKSELYEFTNRIVPSLKRKQQKLETACYSRQPIEFRDKDSYYYQVGIEDIEFMGEPENQNQLHFTATLVEINTLTTTQSITDLKDQKANNPSGTNDGKSSSLGSTQSNNKTELKKMFDAGGITKVLSGIGAS